MLLQTQLSLLSKINNSNLDLQTFLPTNNSTCSGRLIPYPDRLIYGVKFDHENCLGGKKLRLEKTFAEKKGETGYIVLVEAKLSEGEIRTVFSCTKTEVNNQPPPPVKSSLKI